MRARGISELDTYIGRLCSADRVRQIHVCYVFNSGRYGVILCRIFNIHAAIVFIRMPPHAMHSAQIMKIIPMFSEDYSCQPSKSPMLEFDLKSSKLCEFVVMQFLSFLPLG